MTDAARARPRGLLGTESPSARVISGRSPSVIALHGFGASPREVDVAMEQARGLGLAASAPLLAGHGTSSRDLAETRFTDWFKSAERAFSALPEGPVVALGFSLGSLLALELTLEYPSRVVGLILIGNALWLRSPYPSWVLECVDRLGLPDFFIDKRHGPDIADPEAKRTQVTYDDQSALAGVSVLRAGQRLREQLGSVQCPTLILHGARDRVCPPSNAWRAAIRLGTADVRVRLLPRSRHIVTRDYDRDDVALEIRRFLVRLSHPGYREPISEL